MTDPLDGGHLEIDILADLDEGLLTPIETAAADEHLRLCVTCREDRARLSATRALLAALPPEPMPPDVARRLETALQGAAATVVPLTDRRRRPWIAHPTATGLVAAAAVAALIAAVVVGAFGHSKSTPEAAANSRAPQGVSGALGAEAAPAFPTTVSGTTYTPANVDQQLSNLLAQRTKSGAEAPPSGSSAPSPSTFAPNTAPQVPVSLAKFYTNRAVLEACIHALVQPPADPLTVDFGRYNDPAHHRVNQPAIVLVFANQFKTKAAAYIVGPGCANDVFVYHVMQQP